ncbi:5'-nucleotidase C-terminal domain-containing protein [candidate division CSSED10-310 bacterium]|uniref:5'-nucleotidase C-terminal domain-containing protein n=1 Tax=candidate division CSSED10-310 bacterium TaxID=2855610 RepID=A0ABV6YT83_UNCC1
MTTKNIMCKLLFIPCLCFLLSVTSGSDVRAQSYKYLSLFSVGIPAQNKVWEAWKVHELQLFEGKLYIGYGDAVINTGPTDVIYYDLQSKEYKTEFTVDEEAISRYKVIDGKLIIPGIDATESWKLGNIYVRTASGWAKKRSVTHGLHVNDITSFKGEWFVSTGSFFEYGENESCAVGGILRSNDEGDTFRLVFTTPYFETSVFRVGSLITFQDKIYASYYAFRGLKKEEIPESYWPGLGTEYEGQHLIMSDDVLGNLDVLAYDGKQWSFKDLITTSNLCRLHPFVFGDKLIFATMSGQYIDYLGLMKKMPPQAETALFIFDGHQTERISFEYDRIEDVVIFNNRLFLLIIRAQQYFIAETADLQNWQYFLIPNSGVKPRSIEYDGSSFYVGMDDGTIFQATVGEEISDLTCLTEHEPIRIHGAAEIPRQGKWYWVAMTGWRKWGKLARFTAFIESQNCINLTVHNVSAIRVFIPPQEINTTKPVFLKINGQQVFQGTLNGKKELICKSPKPGQWEVKSGNGSSKTFKYEREVVGHTDEELTKEGHDPLIGLWKAETIRQAARTDISLILKHNLIQGLPAGEIAVEDLYDLNEGRKIWTFSTTGEKLLEMLAFNIKLPEKNRMQIAGFDFWYQVEPDAQKNKLVSCSLLPEREYSVSTTDQFVKWALFNIGVEVEKYKETDLTVVGAMIAWLQQYNKIGSLPTRITKVAVQP